MNAIFALLLISAPLEVDLSVQTGDAGGIEVGAPFRVIIEAKHAEEGVALLPEVLPFDEAKLGERKNVRRHVRRDEDGKIVDRYELELLAFESGMIEVPPIQLALGATHAATNKLELDVKTTFTNEELPVATATIPEAMPELEKMAAQNPEPLQVTVDDHRPLYAAGILATVLLAGLLLYRVLKNRKVKPAAAPPPPPPRPAHVIAREKLELLRRAGHLERNDKKTFFVELSAILREYAGLRWGFDSLDLTIDELMVELSKKNTAGLDAQKLESVLGRADLVKFAKFDPTLAEATGALSEASELVEKTKAVSE